MCYLFMLYVMFTPIGATTTTTMDAAADTATTAAAASWTTLIIGQKRIFNVIYVSIYLFLIYQRWIDENLRELSERGNIERRRRNH